MRKDRLSFVVLFAEIAGIVVLHSLKSADEKSLAEAKPVKTELVYTPVLQNPDIFLHTTMILPVSR